MGSGCSLSQRGRGVGGDGSQEAMADLCACKPTGRVKGVWMNVCACARGACRGWWC